MRMRTCASLLALAIIGLAPASAQTPPRRADLGGLSRSLRDVVTKVSPAVVQIQVAAYGPINGGASGSAALLGNQRSSGSGAILSPDGFIITNAHVIEGRRRVVVELPRPAAADAPKRSVLPPVSLEVPARLVGLDEETDLAVLKVELKQLPFARLGDSDSLSPGELVLSFGSPFGLTSSVTMGALS